MTTKFIMYKDINGQNGYILPFSDSNINTTLVENIEQSCTVPIDAQTFVAVFFVDPSARIWVSNNSTASSPGASFTSSLSQGNPTSRIVNAGDVLSFITPDPTAQLGVSFYAL